MRAALLLAIQLYLLITVMDVFLAWLQPRPDRWPRRAFHWLTEPLQRPLRALLRQVPTGGWDLSPLFVLVLLAAVRVWLMQP